jgi:hypothetical protein
MGLPPGWWQDSNGGWHPPNNDEERSAKPEAASLMATETFASVERVPVPSKRQGMTPIRGIYLAAVAGSFIGLLLPWGTASAGFASISIAGTSTSDGKLLGVVLLMAVAFSLLRLFRTRRYNGVISIILWCAIAAIAIYEIVHLSITPFPASNVLAQVGAGLYVNAVAGVAGAVTALIDTVQWWSPTASGPRPVQSWPQPSRFAPASLESAVSRKASDEKVRPSSRIKWVGLAIALIVLGAGLSVGVADLVQWSGSSASPASSAAANVQTLPYVQSGSGIANTSNFQVTQDSFHFSWSYGGCPAAVTELKGTPDFSVSIADSNGSVVASDWATGDSSDPPSGSGVSPTYHGTPGVYQLQVMAYPGCHWQLNAAQP